MPRTTKNGQIHVVRIMQSMNDKFFVIQGATTGSARMLGSYQFAIKCLFIFIYIRIANITCIELEVIQSLEMNTNQRKHYQLDYYCMTYKFIE